MAMVARLPMRLQFSSSLHSSLLQRNTWGRSLAWRSVGFKGDGFQGRWSSSSCSPLRMFQPAQASFMEKKGVEMGFSKAPRLSGTRMNYTQAAQSSPDENEDERLIAGDSLKSDGSVGSGGGGGGGGSGGGGQGQPDSGGNRPAHPVLAWYMKLLEERPVTTKAVTAALLTFVGDLFTQLVIEKSGGIDIKRIAVISSLGLMLVGPTLHFWYLTLSKVVKLEGLKGVGVRLLLDQLLFSPIFIGVFFICLLTLEGRPSDIGPKLSQDWPSAVITNWKLWIPFQCINFMFVPQQLQVAFANVVALIWNAYLSFATHTHVDPSGK